MKKILSIALFAILFTSLGLSLTSCKKQVETENTVKAIDSTESHVDSTNHP